MKYYRDAYDAYKELKKNTGECRKPIFDYILFDDDMHLCVDISYKNYKQ